ncbi:protein PAL OF QUIRKY-like [Salvia miltiorrhiza]|uniref:protein PAL OF QUIRKY-like n=1 Tax=Salvia miltiorrhiza TaxID=226208 RepID=UPI0025AB8006|nr:protein PAL OF QUIRKY-like [Salvia miltiorrhiza]
MENYSYNSSYPESGHSSPRSREIEFENSASWDDQPAQNYKVKFMCSYGGKIHPRPHDNQLSYVGGETKILAVDRSIKFGALLSKLIALCDCDAISFKYQLPGEDLDALISVTNDDDLEHMMHEYDRLYRISPKPARLRVFLFPNQAPSLNSSAPRFGSDEAKTDKERFVDALNSAPQPSVPAAAAPQPVSSVDFLLGFEKANAMAAARPAHQPMEDPVIMPGLDERLIGSDPIQKHIQDLQRLRIEEQQGMHRRKSDDNLSAGSTGGEYNKMPEKIPHVPVSTGIPYWTDKQVPSGVFPASTISNEKQVYVIPAPANAYPAPIMRPANGPPTQGYYAVQRMPTEVYRDQQPMYNMIPQGGMPPMAPAIQTMPPQKVAGYSEGFGMVRPGTTGGVGMVAEAGYAPVAYDGGAGRQVVYSAPGGVMGQPAQYQGMAADMRPAAEAGGKAAAKATQASV